MSSLTHLSAALSACVLLVAAPAAQAVSASANAAFTQFSIELIDLDSTDNVAPAITFTSDQAWAYVRQGIPADALQTHSYGNVTIGSPESGGSASISSTDAFAHVGFTSEPGKNHYLQASTERLIAFTLTPNTAMKLSALGHLDGAEQGSDGAKSSLAVHLSFGAEQDAVGHTTRRHWWYDLGTGSRDYTIAYQLSSGSQGGSGELTLIAESTIEYLPSALPVPEPASAAMLLAGLAMVGAAARRRGHRLSSGNSA